MFLEIVGWIGAFSGMCINIPQLVKTLKTRKVSDLSVWQYVLVMITSGCFCALAIDAGILSMTVANGMGFVIAVSELILIIRLGQYDRN